MTQTLKQTLLPCSLLSLNPQPQSAGGIFFKQVNKQERVQVHLTGASEHYTQSPLERRAEALPLSPRSDPDGWWWGKIFPGDPAESRVFGCPLWQKWGWNGFINICQWLGWDRTGKLVTGKPEDKVFCVILLLNSDQEVLSLMGSQGKNIYCGELFIMV